MKKRKIAIIIVAILLVGTFFLLGSYAFWQISKQQSDINLIGSGCFDIEFTEGPVQNIELLNQFPITDVEGMALTPYTITVENTCTLKASYQVNLEILNGTTLPYTDIKIGFNGSSSLLSSFEDVDVTLANGTSSKKLATGSLNPQESLTFDLRMWLNEAATIESATNKIILSKLVIAFVPEETEVEPPAVMARLDISDKDDLVGILYSTWFNPLIDENGTNQYNITEILAGNSSWGPENAFHYWAKPALGYYRSDDENVIRTHMTQLNAAGVDFIIIDNTNVGTSWYGSEYWEQMVNQPMTALLDTMLEMREEGLETPYLVTWNNTSGTNAGEWMVTKIIYNLFYREEQYADLFVYWNDLPFFITTEDMSSVNPAGNDFPMTWRKMWGLQPTLADYEWSYLQVNNIKGGQREDDTYEQMGVSVAMQQAYMSNTNTIYPNAVGRNYGITWYNQWANAFTHRPKIVTLTWWNEWAAQRIYANSRYNFTDNYNQAYSRDIEPMTGGHGSQYYDWLVEYINAYKGHEGVPRLVESGH